MGDSHARRRRDQAGTHFRLRNVQMEFCCKGETRLSFLTIPESQEHCDLIIFMIGSDDLGDGISPSSIYAHLKGYANEYLEFAEKSCYNDNIFSKKSFLHAAVRRVEQFNHSEH